MMKHGFFTLALAAVAMAGQPQAPTDIDVLAKALTVPLKIARGEMPAFTVTVSARRTVAGGIAVPGRMTFVRVDNERFSLSIHVADVLAAELVRDAGETRLVVPASLVAFVGKGAPPKDASLRLDALIAAATAVEPRAQMYLAMVQAGQPQSMAFLIQQFVKLQRVPDKAPAIFVADRGEGKGAITVTTTADGASIGRIAWGSKGETTSLDIDIAPKGTLPTGMPKGLRVVAVDRAELEHTLARAAVRGLELANHTRQGNRPADAERTAGAGRLTVEKGRRIVRLEGGPRDLGLEHGKLLAAEVHRTCDTVVHLGGLITSIQHGTWIPDMLRELTKRTMPLIPAEYRAEMEGLAEGAGLPLELVQAANIYPEFFWSSGFVVLPKGSETKKLYHGHTLNTFHRLGLHRDAALFVIQKDGVQPFMHTGFAGLVGAAAGVNKAKVVVTLAGRPDISPKAAPCMFLTRTALERGDTFENAIAVLRAGPHDGGSAWLVSDGEKERAALVGPTREGFKVHRPGQPHGVEHCLIVAHPGGYEEVIASLKKDVGDMTSYKSRKLLRPPMSDGKNIHSILFMPQGHDVDIAIARGSSPAYKESYKRYDLKDFLPKKPAKPKEPTAQDKAPAAKEK